MQMRTIVTLVLRVQMRCPATCMYAVLHLLIHDSKLVAFWPSAAVPVVNTSSGWYNET